MATEDSAVESSSAVQAQHGSRKAKGCCSAQTCKLIIYAAVNEKKAASGAQASASCASHLTPGRAFLPTAPWRAAAGHDVPLRTLSSLPFRLPFASCKQFCRQSCCSALHRCLHCELLRAFRSSACSLNASYDSKHPKAVYEAQVTPHALAQNVQVQPSKCKVASLSSSFISMFQAKITRNLKALAHMARRIRRLRTRAGSIKEALTSQGLHLLHDIEQLGRIELSVKEILTRHFKCVSSPTAWIGQSAWQTATELPHVSTASTLAAKHDSEHHGAFARECFPSSLDFGQGSLTTAIKFLYLSRHYYGLTLLKW